VVQRRDGAGLLLEASRVLSLELLDGDDAIKPSIPRFHTSPIPPAPNGRKDFVGAEFFAGR